jgi:hypothetical protein
MDDQHAIEDLAVPEDRLGYTTISFSTTERWPSLANVVAICRLRVCHRFYMCSRTCKQTRGKYIGASRSTLGPLAVMACGLIRSDFYIYIYIYTHGMYMYAFGHSRRDGLKTFQSKPTTRTQLPSQTLALESVRFLGSGSSSITCSSN